MSDSSVVVPSGEGGEQGQVDNDLMPNSVELSVSVLTNTFIEQKKGTDLLIPRFNEIRLGIDSVERSSEAFGRD